tara:strand:+ start:114 stop:827 length:714 start_codon:yes stop_codon:yes gene_type:complete
MIKKIILSPPFSNLYPDLECYTRITGTYTLKKRKGMHRVLTTLRKTKSGWKNNVGLRNPGIEKFNKKNSIVSIALENILEWKSFFKILKKKKEKYNIIGIEFNVSCPNHSISNVTNQIIKEAKSEFNVVILKIPHGSSKKQLDFYCNTCADFLHVSNSKKTNQGSISGRSLIDQNLLDIIYIKEKHNDSIKIIAGGGIYYFEDLILYKKAGADYFSLSTCLLNPFRTYNIIKKSQYL